MSDAEEVLFQLAAGRATLTLNRPEKLNALNFELFQSLSKHLDSIEKNIGSIGCLVVKGAGRSFSAGNDLGTSGDAPEPMERWVFRSQTIERIALLPIPVIAQIHGHCLTGGLELALAADIMLASETAKFADTHGKWNFVPVWGLSQRLPRRIGRAKALEMSFTGRFYSGIQAQSMGLVNSTVPDDQLEETVASFATDVLANSWRSNRAIKKLVLDTDGLPLKAGLAHELFRSEGPGTETAARLAGMRT